MRSDSPGQSSLLLLDVVDILNESHISYAVIGALAASFYGTIRASMDADAVISLQSSENKKDPQILIRRIIKAGFKAACRYGDCDDPIAGVINVEDHHSNRVDLLLGVRGMPADVFSRAVDTPFSGSRIRIIGLEDFIAMKIFAGSPKDIEDAKNAMKVSAGKINAALLKKLTRNYGKGELKVLEVLLDDIK